MIIAQALSQWAASLPGPAFPPETIDPLNLYDLILVESPPKPELGDLAFPLFPFAKILRKGPPQVAGAVALMLQSGSAEYAGFIAGLDAGLASGQGLLGLSADIVSDFRSGKLGTAEALGPYLNVRLNRAAISKDVLSTVAVQGREFGNSSSQKGQRIVVEFSSPNTNKPLHLGHLRNNALGESASRLLAASGAEVKKVCLFNNRGIHICKSMIAWQRWGKGSDPVSQGKKTDHFVAEYYVRFQNELKKEIGALKATDPALAALDDDAVWMKTELGKATQEMLVAWENNDPAVRQLWETMNGWAISGIMETYRKTGISFDWVQYEHEVYLRGKEEVLKGLASGVFFKRPDGAVAVELPWKDGTKAAEDNASPANAQKVVLRADGTSIYLTQDLGTAIMRHELWPFDQAVYVVASEQDYHFKVLFHSLKVLGHQWAEKLYHLSYGLVNLPTGRMKTREGTVVDADDLLDELAAGAAEEIKAKGREEDVGDIQVTAYQVALAALHYFLLQTSPGKDMIFNPEDSLSFAGNTGPYLQYMGARISSMLRKWDAELPRLDAVDTALLGEDQAWELVTMVAAWPETVAQAARDLDPSRITTALYELAKSFSRFYHDLPIITAPSPNLAEARLALSQAVAQVLRHGFHLLNIPFLEAM